MRHEESHEANFSRSPRVGKTDVRCESREFSARVSAYDVLGKELANGRYCLTAYLCPDGEVVEVKLAKADLAVPRS
jgi:hypothetical protein